ncbi:oligosaccharide flippase family protein [Flavobacterium sp. F52]|uniref:oligosaccharide flippase family protein n=1 Tax=Flavobacterium sp. F52 TaxID=1202532 RepID=UPI000272FA55|nr:oligosaccharide flippase family protein [Flavobacterium sp. F52]EJG01878.1 polysaccharide biosynthesis protein [Flavobacterium sp. F52]
MNKNHKKSYAKALKATTIFGGVQIVVILFQILKSKAVAVLIGASGMGVLGLLTQTVTFLSAITNFGLESSAVKNISSAEASGNKDYLYKTISVFRRLVFYTGTLGFLTCLSLSPFLSSIVFENETHTASFIISATSLLFMQLAVGQNAILQGMRKMKLLAKASVLSSFAGLFVSVPIYYFMGIDGIAISITISAFVNFLIPFFLVKKINIGKVSFNKDVFKVEGRNMLKMGFLLSMSGLISIGSSFLLRIFITRDGSLADVGLYNAGFAIIEGYVGIIFTAMAKDYYPRLSMVSNDVVERNREVNQQTEIAILFLIPILTVFLLFLNLIILILYTKEFLPALEMIQYAVLGMFFRAISWSMGYLLLAKGDSKIFFWSELISTIYIFSLNILGYKFLGLKGIGIAFVAIYFLHAIQIYFTTKLFYNYSFDKNLLKVFLIGTLLIVSQFFIVTEIENPYKYFLGTIICGIGFFISFKELDDKIGILTLIKSKIGNR